MYVPSISITWIEYTAYTFKNINNESHFIPILLKHIKCNTYDIVLSIVDNF